MRWFKRKRPYQHKWLAAEGKENIVFAFYLLKGVAVPIQDSEVDFMDIVYAEADITGIGRSRKRFGSMTLNQGEHLYVKIEK